MVFNVQDDFVLIQISERKKLTFNVKESCVVRRLVVGWFLLVIH